MTSIGVESDVFGEIKTVDIFNLQFKRLQSGIINELKVSILDEKWVPINNNCVPISVVLEIKKMSRCKD